MRGLAVVVACLLSTPAFGKYYVVHDLKTKECKVVNTMPLNSTTVTVVGPAFFETRKAAEDGIKNIIICAMK
jgi:hypothetical protein